MKLALMGCVLAATGSVARAEVDTADSSPPPTGSPHLAGRNELALAMPFDVALGDGHTAVGIAGVGLALGRHLTDAFYAGGAAEYELVVDTDTNGMRHQTLENRLRAAGELRWYFAGGTALHHDDLGNPLRAPVHFSVALRGGAQGASTSAIGPFADATLGVDFDLDSLVLGVYVSGGASRIARDDMAYADPDRVTELDVTAGLRLGWLTKAR